MIERLHGPHLGVQRTIARSKNTIYWPGLRNDIKKKIDNCEACLKYKTANQKEPLQQHPIPYYPYQRVGADLFQWNNRNHLITTDFFSNLFEVDELHSTTASSIISLLKRHFARNGIPEVLVADGGPQFNTELHQLAEE